MNNGFEERKELVSGDRYFVLSSEFPTIVCLCGSTRFSKAFQEANLMETLAGKIVLTIGCDLKPDQEIFEGVFGEKIFERIGFQGTIDRMKEKLDELHLRKIDLANEVLILNVGGYVGESTRREMTYAYNRMKRIRFLEPGYAYLIEQTNPKPEDPVIVLKS